MNHQVPSRNNEAEDALRQKQEQLDVALKSAGMGTWYWDTLSDTITWDEYMHPLFGLKPGRFSGKTEDFLGMTHSHDLDRVRTEFEAALKGPTGVDTEYRILWPDGSIHHVALRGSTRADGDGLQRGITGVCWDITERKRGEDEIRQRNRELESLAAITDLAGRSLDRDHLLSTVLPEIANTLEIESVFIHLCQEDRLAMHGPLGTLVSGQMEGTWLRMGDCLCGLAVAEGESIFSENIREDPRCTSDSCRKAGLTSVAAIPLRSAHQKVGALIVASFSRRDFRENQHFLSAIADSLASAIENAELYQEIKNHAAELGQRVAERTTEFQAAIKELEAFSYAVSHDLRAPLRSIDGFSQAIEEEYGERLDKQGRDYLRRVRLAAHRMGYLIDDLLKLSRLSRGALRRKEIDLSAMARLIVKELMRSGHQRNVDFIIADGLCVKGDHHLLQVALENLVQNAWKFTEKQTRARIEVGTTDLEGERAYFVRDNGVGFHMAYADKLFGPFQRLHSASEFPGSGIGLATVKRIITRHGGRVWAEAKEGEGATFYFTVEGLTTEWKNQEGMDKACRAKSS